MIYELEGHTMLRLQYGDLDACVSWGVFDFNAPNFVYRFVKGETDYMAAAFPTGVALKEYADTHRRVSEQVLNLNRQQSLRLVELVNENLRAENATYRYNYLYDNCATRPVALIETAVQDTIHIQPSSDSTFAHDLTFRRLMRAYHRNYPWYQFGIDLALGSGIDEPITNRESCFAPVRLMGFLSSARFSDNRRVMLPAASADIITGNADGIALDATPWWLTPDAICWCIGLICMAWLLLSWKRGKRARVLVSCIFGVNTLVGLLLTFLIFVSVHEATSPNWLYLWLNPLCIVGAIGVWLKKTNVPLVCYHFANFVAIVTLVGIDVAGIQSLNSAFYPLMLPDAAISLHYLYLFRKSQQSDVAATRP
ncbi:MAG: DUF4105 domain-containing protein [Candidatus Amulumruptor caecigallinarius]|nr:DUF4105 domain-containing protein [Candidatus Amulumruptor caecigallinarius]MCM1453773.1 DUF4105 domain-containing protein [bacterium]